MARVKRSIHARKKRRTVLTRAKGYYGAKSRSYRAAKEQVQHSLQYMYRDRRNKKQMCIRDRAYPAIVTCIHPRCR